MNFDYIDYLIVSEEGRWNDPKLTPRPRLGHSKEPNTIRVGFWGKPLYDEARRHHSRNYFVTIETTPEISELITNAFDENGRALPETRFYGTELQFYRPASCALFRPNPVLQYATGTIIANDKSKVEFESRERQPLDQEPRCRVTNWRAY